jgi:hypothetical protein
MFSIIANPMAVSKVDLKSLENPTDFLIIDKIKSTSTDTRAIQTGMDRKGNI